MLEVPPELSEPKNPFDRADGVWFDVVKPLVDEHRVDDSPIGKLVQFVERIATMTQNKEPRPANKALLKEAIPVYMKAVWAIVKEMRKDIREKYWGKAQ